jgi:hypothetical protein
MLTEFLKANVGDFLDLEASEGGSGFGETTDSDKDGMLQSQKIIFMLILYGLERMASLMTTTTTAGARKTWDRQKTTTTTTTAGVRNRQKTPMHIVRFIIHVLLYDETYDSAVVHAVPDAFLNTNRGSWSRSSTAMASNDSSPLDYRLEEVINRYEAQISGARDEIESSQENVFEYEQMATWAECAMQMPSEDDPGLWRVRVRVSL